MLVSFHHQGSFYVLFLSPGGGKTKLLTSSRCTVWTTCVGCCHSSTLRFQISSTGCGSPSSCTLGECAGPSPLLAQGGAVSHIIHHSLSHLTVSVLSLEIQLLYHCYHFGTCRIVKTILDYIHPVLWEKMYRFHSTMVVSENGPLSRYVSPKNTMAELPA